MYRGQEAQYGRLTQRQECFVYTEEVGGSNPSSPTMCNNIIFAAMAKKYSLKSAVAGAILKGFPPSNTISPTTFIGPVGNVGPKGAKGEPGKKEREHNVAMRKLDEWYRKHGIDPTGV